MHRATNLSSASGTSWHDRPDGRRQLAHPLLQLEHGARRVLDPAPAGQHVVQDQPERVDVDAMIDVFATRLLGRHVLDRSDDGADDRGCRLRHRLVDGHPSRCGRILRRSGRHRAHARGRARNPEVHDDRDFVVDHHVRGLEVAVNDAGLVRRLQAGSDLPDDRHHLRDRQLRRVAQNGRQVGAFDVRHRDVLDAVDLSEVVDADDVLVRDLPGQQQFLLEATLDVLRRFRVVRSLRANDLQRHGDVQFGVPGLIHGAHPADAQLPENRVARSELFGNLQRAEADFRCGRVPDAARRYGQPGRVSRRIVVRRGCGGAGAEKTVSASSRGTGVRTLVATEEGSSVLQAGQRPPVSDTSPPQFGHFITRARPQGRLPARFPLLRLCGWVRKYQSPKGFPQY